MELALGAFAMMGSAGAAAGTAVAAGSTLMGAGSTALSIASGVMTAGSILTSLAGGVMANNEAKLQATATELQSREEAVRIKSEELQKIGAARVAFGASGVSLASGEAIENSLQDQSDFERGLALNSGRVSAGQIKLRGQAGLVEAAGRAMGTAADFAIDLKRRG